MFFFLHCCAHELRAWTSLPKSGFKRFLCVLLCTFSISILWFCCIGFSVCNFSRLMTPSRTCEASLTKIQQHNVHSIFVSFPPPPHSKKEFQSALGHLESLVVLATVHRWRRRLEGKCFRQTDGKASLCCTHTLAVISWPALTFSRSLQSELMCWSCSFPLKNRCRWNI